MSKSIIKVSNLTYTYAGLEKPTIHDVNFEIGEGEFVLMTGASGCGKSTILQTLNGIIPQNKGGKLEGTVEVAGMNVAEYEIQQMAEKVGMVFQDPESQLCNLFIKDEVAFGPENLMMPVDEILQRVDDSLSYVGLAGQGGKYVNEISGGQAQRLVISSVISMNPEVLVFDDPTANLDPVGTAEIVSVLEKMKAENKTILISTPWLDEFVRLATRIIVIKDGTVYADGTPKEVFLKYGDEMKNNMGVWIPAIAEIDLGMKKLGLSSGDIALSVDEAFEKYKDLPKPSNKPAPRMREGQGNIVEVSNVAFTYPDGTKALTEVNFTAQKGTLTAILGPNGSGKSTIAQILVGLLRGYTGDIKVCGLEPNKVDIKKIIEQVGFVFQNPEHQIVAETVYDEIAYSMRIARVPEEEIKPKVEALMELFGLAELRDVHPYGLSGGQKRRLSVATMLINEPPLLILDEPTYGQDAKNTQILMKEVNRMLENGVSVMMITHNMRIVQEYADSVVVLGYGKIRYSGLPELLWESGDFSKDSTLKQPGLQQLMERLRKEAGMDIDISIRTISQFLDIWAQ